MTTRATGQHGRALDAADGQGETDGPGEHEKRDRQMIELLNELRIALPGVQILFAFLLTIPFAQGWEKTTPFQRDVYLVVLMASVFSTACFIAPTAAHRMRFHKSDRAYIIESASSLMTAGLLFLAVALSATVLLITDVLFGDSAKIIALTAVTAVVVLGLWFARPLLRGNRSSGP